MNRVEVSRAGQPRLCPMPGREVGGGRGRGETGRPAWWNESRGWWRLQNTLPLFTAQQPAVRLLRARTRSSSTALLGAAGAPLGASPGDPPLSAACSPPGLAAAQRPELTSLGTARAALSTSDGVPLRESCA